MLGGPEMVKESVLRYVAMNFKEIGRTAWPTLALLKQHPGLSDDILRKMAE